MNFFGTEYPCIVNIKVAVALYIDRKVAKAISTDLTSMYEALMYSV